MTDIRYLEVEVIGIRHTGDNEGVVIFRERFPKDEAKGRRFLMGFSDELMLYMEIARVHHRQHGELIGHGAAMRFYEENSGMRLDHITISRADGDDRYEMICHGTAPSGDFSRSMLPSDAISMGLFAEVSFWMEEFLFIQAAERSRLSLETLDSFRSTQTYDALGDLESIPDEDLPKQ